MKPEMARRTETKKEKLSKVEKVDMVVRKMRARAAASKKESAS